MTPDQSNYPSGRKIAAALALAILLLIAASWLTGCMTAKNLPRHNDKFPLASAQYFAKNYSPKDSLGKPDTVYVKADNEDYGHRIDSVSALVGMTIDSLNALWIMTLDSATNGISDALTLRLLAARKEADNLRITVDRLRAAYRPCKPDTVHIRDTMFSKNTPELRAALLELAAEKRTRQDAEADRDSWKSKAQVRFWILLSIILLFVGLGAGYLYRKSKAGKVPGKLL